MSGIRIASRYAKSLIDLCIEKGQVDAVFADMKLIHSTIDASRDLELMLTSPIIKTDTKDAILQKVFGPSVSVITKTFIELLTRKGREGMLLEIAASFVSQVKKHKNITVVKVVSAAPLDAESRSTLIDRAMKLAKGEVELVEKTDADLIGGFVLQVGDQQVDASVSSRLRNLKREFSENPYVPEI